MSRVNLTNLHVNQAQDLYANMGVHFKHLVELAHLEQHGRVKMPSLEFPPVTHNAQN